MLCSRRCLLVNDDDRHRESVYKTAAPVKFVWVQSCYGAAIDGCDEARSGYLGAFGVHDAELFPELFKIGRRGSSLYGYLHPIGLNRFGHPLQWLSSNTKPSMPNLNNSCQPVATEYFRLQT